MKHLVKSKTFNRDTNSRKALLMNGVRSLVEHGQLKTSESRAKEIARIANKLISKAKAADLSARRQLHRFFGKRDVVNTLVDRIVPAVTDRQSGFVSIKKLANRRGDNTTVYQLDLLVKEKSWTSLNNDARRAKKDSDKKVAPKTKKAVKRIAKPTDKKAAEALRLEALAKQENLAASKAAPNVRSFTRRKTGEK